MAAEPSAKRVKRGERRDYANLSGGRGKEKILAQHDLEIVEMYNDEIPPAQIATTLIARHDHLDKENCNNSRVSSRINYLKKNKLHKIRPTNKRNDMPASALSCE